MLNLPQITFKQIAVMFAVILASVTTGFHNRLLLVALPDLRGVWGLDIDEGTILISLALAPQLLLASVAPWLSRAFGIRRTVIPSSLLLIFVTFLIPFLRGFVPLVIAHAVAGALFGIFITLSIAVLNKNLPPAWMVVPLAFYSYSLTFSINTGVTVGGFYIEQTGWHWIYWQTSILMLVYLLVVRSCSVQDDPVQKEMIRGADWSGMFFFCTATTLLYIGFYHGERLDWLDSGIVSCCLWGGLLLFLLFCFNEKIARKPWAPLRSVWNRNVFMCLLLTGTYCFIVTANSLLITQFLETVRYLKPEQTGLALLPIPLLHLVFIPVAIILTRFLDGRLIFALGACCFAVGCWLGMFVTADWVAKDFLPVGILFSLGHPLCFMGIMALTLSNFEREKLVSILAFLHVFRVLFPAIATSIILFVERIGKDAHALYIKQHLMMNDPVTGHHLEIFHGKIAEMQKVVMLEASVRAFQDAFQISFWIAVSILLILFLMRPSKATPICPVGV